MKKVGKLLENKGREVWSTTPDTSVFDALQMMADKNVGALVVLDRDHIAGIFSERDYARKVILHGKSSREIRVRDIMTTEVACVRPDQAIEALETSRKMEEFDVVARCVLVRLYQGRGDFAMSKPLSLEALKIDSKSIAARLGWGHRALRSGVLHPALRNLMLALEEDPRCWPAHAARAEG